MLSLIGSYSLTHLLLAVLMASTHRKNVHTSRLLYVLRAKSGSSSGSVV